MQTNADHIAMAIEALQNAFVYFESLQKDFGQKFGKTSIPSTQEDMVSYFANCQPEDVRNALMLARGALVGIDYLKLTELDVNNVVKAVIGIYLLASMRLVNSNTKREGKHVYFVPKSSGVIYSIITKAFYGGILELDVSQQAELIQPKDVYELLPAGNGEYKSQCFERSVYTRVFENKQSAGISALDSEPLSDAEADQLFERRDSLFLKKSFCVVVKDSGMRPADAVPVAERFEIPIMFQSDQTDILLSQIMTPSRLDSAINEFSRQLNEISNSRPSTEGHSGERLMAITNNFNGNIGNLAQNQATGSIAQAGTGQTANIDQRTGLELRELTDLIKIQLLTEINNHPSEESRVGLRNQLELAESELEKAKPDKNVIRNSLESIKAVGDSIEGGEKIVELCTKAWPLLASLPALF
ncbi:hypothetical protein ACQE3E_21205 [Methylomonas sp. MED-D]|uniref:hypothetical protein n=1 Tax=Methylomonas sp. MED-D TaxID=3418768 RepID=UPI003D024266